VVEPRLGGAEVEPRAALVVWSHVLDSGRGAGLQPCA
jgi:hypothetical protein